MPYEVEAMSSEEANESSSADRPAKKARRSTCAVIDCDNWPQKGGMCISHGGEREKKLCSHAGCTNLAVVGANKGSVCNRHGGSQYVKRCSHEGCQNHAQNGNVCIRHGAKRYICSEEGCSSKAARKGKCWSHAEKQPCSVEGCESYARSDRGLCATHDENIHIAKKVCSHAECSNLAYRNGMCWRHNKEKLGDDSLPRCGFEGCNNHVINQERCIKHGAKKRKRCSEAGCTNQAQKGGICIRHGSKPHATCSTEGCNKRPVGGRSKLLDPKACRKHQPNHGVASSSAEKQNAGGGAEANLQERVSELEAHLAVERVGGSGMCAIVMHKAQLQHASTTGLINPLFLQFIIGQGMLVNIPQGGGGLLGQGGGGSVAASGVVGGMPSGASDLLRQRLGSLEGGGDSGARSSDKGNATDMKGEEGEQTEGPKTVPDKDVEGNGAPNQEWKSSIEESALGKALEGGDTANTSSSPKPLEEDGVEDNNPPEEPLKSSDSGEIVEQN